ncbi:transposase, partial [Shigella boydii]
STSKTPSYTKSVSWQHHRLFSVAPSAHFHLHATIYQMGNPA